MQNNNGDKNTAIGGYSLSQGSSSNNFNTAVGYASLYNNGGDYNVAVGYNAHYGNTSGTRNIAIGADALKLHDSEDDNLAIGYEAMKGTGAAGEFNVAIGNYSLKTNSGSMNTAIGYKAGDYTNFTGDENVIIGYEADPVGVDAQNQIVIGKSAVGAGDNTVVIGNTDITAWLPPDDDGVDLGSGSKEFKDLFIDGTANLDAVDIDAGAIDGTAIGANNASTGAFTTVTASTSVDITGSAGLILENDETITNSTDGTVSVGGNLSGTGSISGFDANLNDQTGTTYTLASSDNGKVVALNNGSAITLTVPTSLGDGFNCLIVQKGAGQVTIAAAGGVTLQNGSSQYKTYARYSIITLVNIGSELYIVSGDTGS